MSRKKNSRQWARLRILCSTGLPLMTIVPDAFALVRELIPNAAAVLFLRTETTEGREQQALDDTVVTALPPPNGYYFIDSATFGQIRSHDYDYVIEHQLEYGAEKLGSVTLMRKDGPRFDADDEEDLGRVATYFEFALRNASAPATGLSGVIEDEAMLLATTGGHILFLSDSAG
ncbi:MAG: hypothetical protein ACXWCP_33000, partial [Burkholderiales bacterium]